MVPMTGIGGSSVVEEAQKHSRLADLKDFEPPYEANGGINSLRPLLLPSKIFYPCFRPSHDLYRVDECLILAVHYTTTAIGVKLDSDSASFKVINSIGGP